MIVSPAFITDELRRHGVLPTGEVTSIQVGQRFVACADDVVRLHVNYTPDVDEHAPRTLICKRFGPQWYHINGLPELRFYRDLAPLMPRVPVPSVYGAIDLPECRACILLLEDLNQRYVSAT